MKKAFRILSLLATGLAVVGCQDFENGFSAQEIKNAEYAAHFEKVFGTPDPNQDWSMAQSVGVSINVPSMRAGEVTVYTNSPLGSNCKILGQAKVTDGIAKLNIDVVKGTTSVYVVAKNQDGMAVNGYFDILDNTLSIAKGAATRAAGTPASIGEEMNVNIYMLPTIADMEDPVKGEWYSRVDPTGDYIVGKWNGNSSVQKIPNLYMLDGVDLSTRTDELELGDLATFLRSYTNTEGIVKDGVFKEGTNHVPLMGHEIEADAYYTMAADGPISMDFVYKGTVERHNYFGYFYYPEGETMTADKFRDLKKYVVCPFVTGNANCYEGDVQDYKDVYIYIKDEEEVHRDYNYKDAQYDVDNDGEPKLNEGEDDSDYYWVWDANEPNGYGGYGALVKDGKKQQTTKVPNGTHKEWFDAPTDGSLLQIREAASRDAESNILTWNDWADIGGMAMPTWISNPINDKFKLRGTKIQLTFFGYNGDETPTLTFPQGCKVGFFFLKYAEHGISGGDTSFNKLYTSFATLNRDLINEVPTGATFRYRDYVVLGLEDQPYGDKDQNDILFLAQGNFKTNEIPDLTPDDDPEKEPEPQKWLVACEDLGGDFDYDFNDVVVGFHKADGHLYLTPLASGGTLPSVLSYTDYAGSGLGEIHQMLGDASSNNLYTANTACRPRTAVDLGPCDLSIDVAVSKFYISVKQGDATHNIINAFDRTEGDKTPQMLLLPGGWDWPEEGITITDVYSRFVGWTEDVTNADWTKKDGAKASVNNTWGK